MGQPDLPRNSHDDDHHRHNRRYIVFAVVLALVVLTFAAVSITVVANTTSR
jgi:hypothetical protein